MDDRNYQSEAGIGEYQGSGGPVYDSFRFYSRNAPTMFYQEGSNASTNVNTQFFLAPGAGLDLSNDEPNYILGTGNDIGLSEFMLRNYVSPIYSGGYTSNRIYYVGPQTYQRGYLNSEFYNVEYVAPTYAEQNYAPGTEASYASLTTTFYSRAVNNYDGYVDINDVYGSSSYTTIIGYQGITEYIGNYTDSYDRRSAEVFTGIEYYEGGYTGAYQRMYTEQYELITDYESDVEQYQSTYNSDPTVYSAPDVSFAPGYLGPRFYQRNYTRTAGSFNGFGGTLGYYARTYQRQDFFAGPSYVSTPRYTSDFADYSGPIFEIYADYAGPPSLYVLQYESLYEGPGMTIYTIGYEQSGYDPQDQRQTSYSLGSVAYVGDVFPYLSTYVREGIATYSDSGDYDAYYTTHIYQSDYNSYSGARVTEYNNYVYFGHQPDLRIFGAQYTDASNDAYGGLRYTPTFQSDQGYGDYARGGTIYQGTGYDGVGEIIRQGSYNPQEYQGGLDGPIYIGQRYGGYGDRRYGGTPNFSQYGTDLYTTGYVGPPDGLTSVYERIYDKGTMPRYTAERVYDGYIAADASGFTGSVYLASTQYIGPTQGDNFYNNSSFVSYGAAAEPSFPDPTIANYEEAFAGYVSYYTSPLYLPGYTGPGGAYNQSIVGYAAPTGIIGPTYIQSLPTITYVGFENYSSQVQGSAYLGAVPLYNGYEDDFSQTFFLAQPDAISYLGPGGEYLGGPYTRAYANVGNYVASGQEESITIVPIDTYISYTGARSFLDFTTADPDAQYLNRYVAVQFYGTAGLGAPGYGFYIGPGIPFGPGYYSGAGGVTYTRVGYDASQFYQADGPVYNTNIYVNTYEGNEYFTNYSTDDMYTARLQQIDYGVQYYDALGDVLRYTGEYGTIYEGQSFVGPAFDKAYERLYDNTFTGTYVIGYNVDIKFYSATYEPITASYTLDADAGTFDHAYVAPPSSTYSGPGYTGEAFIDGYTSNSYETTYSGPSIYQQGPYATYVGSYQNDSDQATYTEPGYSPTYTQRYEPLYEAEPYLRSNQFLKFNSYTQNIFEVAYEGASYTNDSNLVYGGTYLGSYTADLYTGAAYSTQYEGGTYTGAVYEIYSSNYDGPNYTTAYDISYDTGQVYDRIISSSTYVGPAVFDRAYETVYADQAKTYDRNYTGAKTLYYDNIGVYTGEFTLIDDQYDTYVGPPLAGNIYLYPQGIVSKIFYVSNYAGPETVSYYVGAISDTNIYEGPLYAGEGFYQAGSGNYVTSPFYLGPATTYVEGVSYEGIRYQTRVYAGETQSYGNNDNPGFVGNPGQTTYLGEAYLNIFPYTDGAGNVYSGGGLYTSTGNEYNRDYIKSLAYASTYVNESKNYVVAIVPEQYERIGSFYVGEDAPSYVNTTYGTSYLGAGEQGYAVGDQPGENYSDYTRIYSRAVYVPYYQVVYGGYSAPGGPFGGYVRAYLAPGQITAEYSDATASYENNYERVYTQNYQLAYNLDILNYTTSYSSNPVYTRLSPADAFVESYDPIQTYGGGLTNYEGNIVYTGGDPEAGYTSLTNYQVNSYIKASPTVIYNGFTDVNQQYTLEGVRYVGEGGYAPTAGYEGQVLYTEPAVTVDYTGPDGVYGDPASYTVEFAGFEVRYDLSLSYEGSLGYQDEYLNRYQANYTEEYTGEFTGVYEQIYSEDYSNEFTAIYTLDYEEPYIGTYTANYIGSFSGETIQATEEETETYTLYVRVA